MSVGKPDAEKQHVRFDERGRETEPGSSEHSHRARPRLYYMPLMQSPPFTMSDGSPKSFCQSVTKATPQRCPPDE